MKSLQNRGVTTALAGVLLASLAATPAEADVAYQVSINTSSVQGTSGFLDFQFNPGNATSQAATATISGFTSDGMLSNSTLQTSGDVTGTLPGTLAFDNLTALNEYFQSFKFGTNITFVVTLGGPAISAPNGAATASSIFGVGLYDASENPILTDQGANTGFGAQIDINLDGSTAATEFPTATGGPSVFTISSAAADAFQVRYVPNLNIGDSFVNITNSGASGGNICANIYTFDPAEELISCCSCSVTPNALQSLSVVKTLISNPLTPAVPAAVVVKILASRGTCNASTVTAGNLAPGLLAWGTALHAQPTAPVSYAVTEGPFAKATLSTAELAHITSTCGFIQSNGSGFGICKGCAAGGLGATPGQ